MNGNGMEWMEWNGMEWNGMEWKWKEWNGSSGVSNEWSQRIVNPRLAKEIVMKAGQRKNWKSAPD